jgi:DNA-binding HxlR family transcriptional regulator
MRSYGQYCAVAKSLDVLGDRWTLLIVRELLLTEELRYTDLRNGLPGIATNLLADRLRELEAAGVIDRVQAPPPVATTLFSLTDRGRQLRPIVDALGRWGIPYMTAGPIDGDVFRSEWLSWPAGVFLSDHRPQDPPVTIELQVGEESLLLETVDGAVRSRAPAATERGDATVAGSPHAVLALLSGSIDLDRAQELGIVYEGDPAVLERVRPPHPEAGSDGLPADALPSL